MPITCVDIKKDRNTFPVETFIGQKVLPAILALLLSSPGFAQSWQQPPDTLDFALNISRQELDLHKGNTLYPVDISQIGVTVFNLSNPNVHYGFIAGYSYLGLENDSPSAGLSLNGSHLGLALRLESSFYPRIRAQGQYLFQQLGATDSGNTITLDWYEWQLESSVRFALVDAIGLSLGVSYTDTDATRRLRGAANSTLSMTLEDNVTAWMELDKATIPSGYVSLTLYRGAHDGLMFSFARLF